MVSFHETLKEAIQVNPFIYHVQLEYGVANYSCLESARSQVALTGGKIFYLNDKKQLEEVNEQNEGLNIFSDSENVRRPKSITLHGKPFNTIQERAR